MKRRNKKKDPEYGNVACMNCRWVGDCDEGHTCLHPVGFIESEPYFSAYTGESRTHLTRRKGYEYLSMNEYGTCKYFEAANV